MCSKSEWNINIWYNFMFAAFAPITLNILKVNTVQLFIILYFVPQNYIYMQHKILNPI